MTRNKGLAAYRHQQAIRERRHARLLTSAAKTFDLVLKRNLFAWSHDPLESAAFLIRVWLENQSRGPSTTATEIVAPDQPECAENLLRMNLVFDADWPKPLCRRFHQAVADISTVYYEQAKVYRGLWSTHLLAQIACLSKQALIDVTTPLSCVPPAETPEIVS